MKNRLKISLLIISDGRYHQYRFRYDTDYFLVKVSMFRLPKRLLPPIFKIINVSHLIKSLSNDIFSESDIFLTVTI